LHRYAISKNGINIDMRSLEFTRLIEDDEQKPDIVLDKDDKAKLDARMKWIIDKMKSNPQAINDIFKKLKIHDEPIPKQKKGDPEYQPDPEKINPSYYLQPKKTAPEKDHLAANKKYLRPFINAMMNAQGDADDIQSFLETYGKVNYINLNSLQKTGRHKTADLFVPQGNVSKEFVADVFKHMFAETAGSRGPGEVSLCLLSPNITFPTDTAGDLQITINNKKTLVEVKGQVSLGGGGGRLKDGKNDFGEPNLNPIYAKLDPLIQNQADPEDAQTIEAMKMDSTSFTASITPGKRKDGTPSPHILDHAQKLERLVPGLGNEFMKEMVMGTYKFSKNEFSKYFKDVMKMNNEQVFYGLARMSYLNYVEKLKAKVGAEGEKFEHVLFISPDEYLYFNVNDMENYVDKFKFQSIDFADKINGPAVQTSL